MPRGGARAGAGRLRQRITLSQDTARMLREIVQDWQEREPACRWTGPAVVDQLVTLEADRLRRETDKEKNDGNATAVSD